MFGLHIHGRILQQDTSQHHAHTKALSNSNLHPTPAGWFSTAPFLGAYSREAQWAKLPAGAAIAAKCWIVATPLALVIRGISKGYVPPTPFIAVSFGVTCLLLVGWRSGLAAATKEVRGKS